MSEPCPTCSWPNRETVDMVCQTCGTDYRPPTRLSLVHGVGSAVEPTPEPISSEASASASTRESPTDTPARTKPTDATLLADLAATREADQGAREKRALGGAS